MTREQGTQAVQDIVAAQLAADLDGKALTRVFVDHCGVTPFQWTV